MPPYNGRYDPHNYHYPNYNSHVPHPPRPHIDWRHEQEDTGVKGVFDVSGVFDTVVSTVKSIVEEAAAGTTEETIILNESSDGYGSIDDINAIFGGNGNGRETVTDKILEETSDAVKEITEKSLIYEHTTPWIHVPHILVTDEHWEKKEPENNPYMILIIVLAVLVVLAAVILAIYTYCKKKRNLMNKEDPRASIIGKTYSGKKLSAQKSDSQKVYGGESSSGIDRR